MYNVLKHETTEDVKQEVLRTLKKDNWKEILCTTPNGTYLNPYQNAKTIVASAKMAPIGVFESEVFCDNMLRQAIIENIDDIARFVIKGVPMKIFVTEYEEETKSKEWKIVF